MPIVLDPTAPAPRTFKDMQDEVLAYGFADSSYRTRVKTWLNEGVHRVARAVRLSESASTEPFGTVAGEPSYQLASSAIRIRQIVNTADRVELCPVEITEINTAPGASGKPREYALEGGNLVLYPTPDAAYPLELWFLANTAKLVGDGDVPAMPDDYLDIAIAWALQKAYAAEDDFPASQFHRSYFDTELSQMRADVQHRQVGRVRRVPSMWADGYRSARPTFERP